MSIFSWLKRNPLVIRYNNGSWEYNSYSAKWLSKGYMDLYLSVYAINACVNIRATYLSKFKWEFKKNKG